MNVLFITADQWRGECLSCLDHKVVRTPNLDRLAKQGVVFKKHYAQATPCAPSRTSLHTGAYMFNHRCVANGTPVSSSFTNWAKEVRNAGYDPSLFGYTDTALDPAGIDPGDQRLKHYSEPLPGIGHYTPVKNDVNVHWVQYLQQQGYEIPERWWHLYGNTVAGTPWREGGAAPLPLAIEAQHHETSFMVEQCIDWINAQSDPWVTHLSLLRPHPPFVAPAPYNAMYCPDEIFTPVRSDSKKHQGAQHPFLALMLSKPQFSDHSDPAELLEACSSYYGLMTEVDDCLGRLFDYLESTSQWSNTLIIFTSDHGEQMGDHWMFSKLGFYDESYYVPLIIRDPRAEADSQRGSKIDVFTENVDIMPTMLDWLNLDIPAQCDGASLIPFLRGQQPPCHWRTEAHWEYDFRDTVNQESESVLGITSHQCNLAVIRGVRYKYVHFTALPPLLFDLAEDPGELTNVAADPEYRQIIVEMLQKMMSWRMNHTARGLTETFLTDKGPVNRSSPLRSNKQLPVSA